MKFSRAKWSKPLTPVAPLRHGENFAHYQYPFLPANSTVNWDMLDCDYTDPEFTLTQCVNPCEVNPVDCYGLVADRLTGNTIVQELAVKAFIEKQKLAAVADVKLEMEEFSDLSQFLPRAEAAAKGTSCDELNTPIFDIEEPFDFAIPANPVDLWETVDSPTDIELNKNILYTQNGGSTIYENNKPSAGAVEGNIVNNITHDKDILYPVKTEGDVYNIISDNDNVKDDTETPMYVQTIEIDHDYEGKDTDVYMIDEDFCSAQTTSPRVVFETPDSSNSGQSEQSPSQRPILRLDVGLKFFQDAISTPDVIDTVTSLESEPFNVFSKLDENTHSDGKKESQVVLEVPSTSNSVISQAPHFDDDDDDESSVSFEFPKKRKRKAYDSDEDYVPPKVSLRHKHTTKYCVDSDEEPVSPPPKKRGRPPGRRTSTVSHTSSASFDSVRDVDKYRELRDKNNEASRKSRFKRRMKEQQLEEEADELNEKNIKLKTQVEELEKQVKNFKDNLFKMILIKK